MLLKCTEENWSDKMTFDLRKMTQAEFDDLMVDLKENEPNLFQFIVDFLDRKVTAEEVDDFLKMERNDQVDYIKNYKARA